MSEGGPRKFDFAGDIEDVSGQVKHPSVYCNHNIAKGHNTGYYVKWDQTFKTRSPDFLVAVVAAPWPAALARMTALVTIVTALRRGLVVARIVGVGIPVVASGRGVRRALIRVSQSQAVG